MLGFSENTKKLHRAVNIFFQIFFGGFLTWAEIFIYVLIVSLYKKLVFTTLVVAYPAVSLLSRQTENANFVNDDSLNKR